jgi:uracil-DNA glycosylase
MRMNTRVKCATFPCTDVRHTGYVVPGVNIQPEEVRIIVISEAAPENPADYYYAKGDPLFQQTTVLAFNDAGVKVSSIKELVALGVYFTTAVKCAKTSYAVQTGTIKACSYLLETELALFPHVQALLLMGDVAIKAVNEVARHNGETRVIPAGSTYKIRGSQYSWRGMRVFPSYLQAGPSFFIEKSKRKMIAEDITAAMKTVKGD